MAAEQPTARRWVKVKVQSSLNACPSEILEVVFSYADCNSLLFSVSHVSRAWRDLTWQSFTSPTSQRWLRLKGIPDDKFEACFGEDGGCFSQSRNLKLPLSMSACLSRLPLTVTGLELPEYELHASTCESLRRLCSLRTLKLPSKLSSDYDTWQASTQLTTLFLQLPQQLTTLHISCRLPWSAPSNVLSTLQRLTCLTTLDASFNSLGRLGDLPFICGLPSLKTLRIVGNNLLGDGVAPVARLTNLETLEVHGNHLGAAGARYLSGLTRLTVLNLAWNGITASGVEALTRLTRLRVLDVRDNQLGASGVEHLTHLRQSLTDLNLHSNGIPAGGACPLLHLTRLRRLNVSRNSLGPVDAGFLGQLKALQEVVVFSNPLGDSGVRQLAAALAGRLTAPVAFTDVGMSPELAAQLQ